MLMAAPVRGLPAGQRMETGCRPILVILIQAGSCCSNRRARRIQVDWPSGKGCSRLPGGYLNCRIHLTGMVSANAYERAYAAGESRGREPRYMRVPEIATADRSGLVAARYRLA